MHAECMMIKEENATIPNSGCTARRHSSGHSKCSPYILSYDRLLLLACKLCLPSLLSPRLIRVLPSRTSTYPPPLSCLHILERFRRVRHRDTSDAHRRQSQGRRQRRDCSCKRTREIRTCKTRRIRAYNTAGLAGPTSDALCIPHQCWDTGASFPGAF